MSLGIITTNFPQNSKSIGLLEGSYGYYSGIKGNKQSYGKSGHWNDYGIRWNEGDIIWVDVDRSSGTISFTHNNKFLGIAFKEKQIKKENEFFFAVSMWGVGDSVDLISS